MRYQVLGPVRAWRDDGSLLDLGTSQRRLIFAVLLLRANRSLSREQLIDAVWGGDCPKYATNLLQKHISALRRQLEPSRPGRTHSDALTWTDAGYRLTVSDGELDLRTYEDEVAAARSARANGELRAAAEVLHRALQRWHGEAFDGLASPLLDAQRDRLAEQRVDLLEDRIDLDLALGAQHDLITELRELVAEHPLRDRLSTLLMLALYRGGRQSQALSVFHEVRQRLRDELGIDPPARLQTLHQQILTGDRALDSPRAKQHIVAARISARPARIEPEHDRGRSPAPAPGPWIDVSVPHPARVHDYWLGGRHNFAADRELAEELAQIMPGIREIASLNQAFVRRAALFMVGVGIRQFIALGSGIPTVEHLHEIVQRADPQCRIVYIDPDPVAVAHSALLFEPVKGTAVIQAGLRHIDALLDAEPTRSLLDHAQPTGLIAPGLHFIPDGMNPTAIIANYRNRLASDSYIALAHVASDTGTPGLADAATAYQRATYPLLPRSYSEVMAMCAGFELVWPGLVTYALWRPEGPEDVSADPKINSVLYAAVGRKP